MTPTQLVALANRLLELRRNGTIHGLRIDAGTIRILFAGEWFTPLPSELRELCGDSPEVERYLARHAKRRLKLVPPITRQC